MRSTLLLFPKACGPPDKIFQKYEFICTEVFRREIEECYIRLPEEARIIILVGITNFKLVVSNRKILYERCKTLLKNWVFTKVQKFRFSRFQTISGPLEGHSEANFLRSSAKETNDNVRKWCEALSFFFQRLALLRTRFFGITSSYVRRSSEGKLKSIILGFHGKPEF